VAFERVFVSFKDDILANLPTLPKNRGRMGHPAPWVHYFLSRVYGFKGMEKESVQELDTQLNRGEKAAAEIPLAHERGGRKAVLQLQLNERS